MSLKEIQNSPLIHIGSLELPNLPKPLDSILYKLPTHSTLNDAHDDYLNHYSHEIQQNHF